MKLQGPVYVGTGCMFRRFALYGFDPPDAERLTEAKESETQPLTSTDFDPNLDVHLLPKRFGNSALLAESIPICEYRGRPIADHPTVKFGRPPGALRVPREILGSATIAEAVSVISCWLVCKLLLNHIILTKCYPFNCTIPCFFVKTGTRTRRNGVTE